MSVQGGFANAAGKKAVHVKWAGKTIALGTFPATEADEKCARAKALTRAWRSTMRPKPTRDWVMIELERLGVRVVSGRLGRKAGEEGDDVVAPPEKKSSGPVQRMGVMAGGSPPMERSNSIGWGVDGDLNSLLNRRTSMGLSMMNDGRRGSLGSMGQVIGLDGGDPTMAHRSLGGGYDIGDAQRRASSLGLGSLAGGGLGSMGMSVNPNQHYEMLKLHHMNLLNEIQETTLMMNLYQQQQLQQQQQQLQQQANAEGLVSGDPQMSMMHQPNGMDPMFGANQLSQQQRASLGLGTISYGSPQMQMMQHQQMMQGSVVGQGQPQQQQQQQQQQPENRSPMGNEVIDVAAPGGDNKRPLHNGAEDENKRQKADDSDDDDDDNDTEGV